MAKTKDIDDTIRAEQAARKRAMAEINDVLQERNAHLSQVDAATEELLKLLLKAKSMGITYGALADATGYGTTRLQQLVATARRRDEALAKATR